MSDLKFMNTVNYRHPGICSVDWKGSDKRVVILHRLSVIPQSCHIIDSETDINLSRFSKPQEKKLQGTERRHMKTVDIT